MTTDTDTAEALEAAIDAIACRRCDHDDPIGSTDRSALHRAITAHVEAEVARRLAAAPGVEAAIGSVTCRRCDHDDPLGDSVSDALRAAIAADKARAVANARRIGFKAGSAERSSVHDAIGVSPQEAARAAMAHGVPCPTCGSEARPTPDEKRRLLDEYDRATRHSYVTGGPERLRAARAALLRALGVEA